MRLTTVLLIASLMQVSAATLAQKISLKEKNAPLEQIFDQIRQQTGYDFLYNKNLLKKARPVNIDLKNATMEETLTACFAGQPFTFSLQEKTIVVKDKAPTFLERVVATLNSIDASGRVVDSENRPLPGASVKVKKTGKGVSTDKDGRFFLRGVEEGAVLVVSFIGYLPKEVNASANMGNVALEQSLSKLDEVQVIAYGTTTQRLSIGNVTTIKADVIEKQPVNNPLLALQGRVPGLFIEQATGFAGTGVKVRIQGQNSMAYGNEPLYVVDGISYTSLLLPGSNGILGYSGGFDGSAGSGNPLNFLNPADIESISILKDADATAIYGSRAANGAILITTKKGKDGDIKVNGNIQNGWGTVSRKLDLMNSQQYTEMRKEAFANDKVDLNSAPYNSEIYKTFFYPDLSLWDSSRNTDWQKVLIGGTAQYTDLQSSISGGSSLTQFLLGAGYHRETNVFPGNFDDVKGSLHFNINSVSSNQKFKIQFSGSYMHDNNQLPDVDFTSAAMRLAPSAPTLYNASGGINWEPNPSGTNSTFINNPLASLERRTKNITTNLLANATLNYTILPYLDVKTSFGYSNLLADGTALTPLSAVPPEYLAFAPRMTTFTKSSINSWLVEPQITFQRTISKGKIEVLFGATLQNEMRDASSILASGFSTDQVMYDIKSATTLSAGTSINSLYRYNALFARANYNWESKYIINLSARRDGSTRFGSQNQYHNFAAVGIAWLFSEEKAIKDNLEFLSFGKIRASYGTTGSDQIPNYKYLSLYNAVPTQVPYQGANGYQPTGLTNPYLQWEETKKLLFGLDLGFFKDRLLFNINYNLNRSSNQLLAFALPIITGFTDITMNFPAKVQNTGWEFMLNSTNLSNHKFKWTTGFNLTVPKNKLLAYPDPNYVEIPTGGYSLGRPLNISHVFSFLGVNSSNGNYLFKKQDGTESMEPIYGTDNIKIISSDPRLYGGIQNSFSYKDFQLDVFFQFVKQEAQNYYFGNGVSGNFSNGFSNQPIWKLNRWQKQGDVADFEKYTTGGSPSNSSATISDQAWSDASYLRLKNLSFSWTVPKHITNPLHIQNCRFYVQGQNLLTITNYLGLDPETKSSLTLPPLRVITLGIKIGL